MHVLDVAGWSGSGKTTLIEGILPLLRGHGLRVSTVKHAHHDFDVDTPGKDSWRHRKAGAAEVLVASGRRFALMGDWTDGPPPLAELLARLAPVDLVLVEGFKSTDLPRIEVWRAALGKPRLPDGPGRLLALATDSPPAASAVPVLDLADLPAIAGFVRDWRHASPPWR